MNKTLAMQNRVRELVEKTPELSLGYIGNVERWGDNRTHYIWVKNLRHLTGNKKSIWSASAPLTVEDWQKAYQAVKIFQLGLEASKIPL